MQTIIVIVLVILAGLYVASRFWRARKGAPCCSDCSGCPCKGGAAGPSGPAGPGGSGLVPLEPVGGCPLGRTPKDGCAARSGRGEDADGKRISNDNTPN